MNERFFQDVPSNQVRISVGELELPLHFYDVEAMISFFPVATHSLARLLPTEELQPALLRPGISLLSIAAIEYKKSSIGAYNELAILIPCLWKPRTNWPLLPFLAPRLFPNYGAYVFRLPVTTEFANIAGREIWGYPQFIANIEFEEHDACRICTLSHEGLPVLTYSVRKSGVPRYSRHTFPTFSRKGSSLLKTQVNTQGLRGVSKAAQNADLQFGRHPLGVELSRLQPGPARISYYFPKMQSMISWSNKSYEMQRALSRGMGN